MFCDEQLVEFGGYSLTLALDFKAIDLIEQSVGATMPEVISLLSPEPPTGVASKIVWAMLRRHHPEWKLDLVGTLMLGQHRNVIAGAMCDLLSQAMNLEVETKSEGSTVKWILRDFLIEWLGLGGSPAEFWRQTPKSYVACMEGMAKRVGRETDLAIATAWHTAVFALTGYSGKLKPLSDYLSSKPAKDDRLENAKLISFFHTLKEKGFPIEITQTRH